MEFSVIVTGVLEENCYIVYDKEENCVVIDPGDDGDTILDFIADNELTPLAILLTHGHFDHIGAVVTLKEKYDLPVYIHPEDAAMLSDPEKKSSFDFGENDEFEADHYIADGQILEFEGLKFQVLHAPGHTKGSCCFLAGDALFTGDTLFKGNVGRCDLEGGSFPQLMHSLQTKIMPLPDELTVHPGHGDFSTIGREKSRNPYLRGDYEEFD